MSTNVSNKRLSEVISYYNEHGKELTLSRFGFSNNTLSEYLWKSKKNGIEQHSSEMNLNLSDVKHGWIKSRGASMFFKNPDFTEQEFDLDNIDWNKILSLQNIEKIEHQTESKTGKFDRVVYSDTHIGMTTNENGFSLYGGKWDEVELMNRLSIFVCKIVDNRKSDILIIDDLGDLMDGWDAHTVRKYHPLPQNMDNQKAFDIALNFKLKMIGALKWHYKEIICHNVCNDNHSGAFGYIVNSALATVCELRYDNVKIINYRKFINHYILDKNVFILSHGKDAKHLKFGFKPKLNAVQIEKIDNYIRENYLHQKGGSIEFSKGDSHQLLLDWSTSDSFNYFNYPAFSPSSEWVQTNYKKGISGFVMFNYFDTTDFRVLPFLFNWHGHNEM